MIISQKYIAIKENKTDHNNFISVRVIYDLGGYNVFTYKEKPRGYYISVSPVERSTCDGVTMETFTAFSGYSELLHACDRKSKKAEAAALEKCFPYEKMMVTYICNKYGYILEA
jgi:hypothetical protein